MIVFKPRNCDSILFTLAVTLKMSSCNTGKAHYALVPEEKLPLTFLLRLQILQSPVKTQAGVTQVSRKWSCLRSKHTGFKTDLIILNASSTGSSHLAHL